ncbi:MAG: signal recognition particle protein, partial [Oscillospiraceae bacterium]|nr:signal recognition particle protein [Oscillospiraceae bacterium]
LTPGQQVIKIVNEEMTSLMGGTLEKLKFGSRSPAVFLMAGLQGAGKTTMCAKLGAYVKKHYNKSVLLCACDIYRPAAIEQLKVDAAKAECPVFERGQQDPVETARLAVDYARSHFMDLVIIDTAGRLHIDEDMMAELGSIAKAAEPAECLLVIDAMTGQDAVNTAKTFHEKVPLTGVILTKLDGDTRGGAALSVRAVTGLPIKFSGIGEKLGDLEPFYPDRMASRILGMGDVLSLIEKAEDVYSRQEAERLAQKLQESKFDMDDLLDQLRQIKKLGDLRKIVSMLPGVGSKLDQLDIDDGAFGKVEAMITSMTREERAKPSIINPSRKKRIAKGSGTQVQDVNRLLKQFDQMQQMMKKLGGKGGRGLFGRRKMPRLDPSMLEGMGGLGGFKK